MIQAGEKRRGLVVGGLVFSLVPIFYLHVMSAGQLNPVTDVISDYVFVDNGTGWLAATSLSLAAISALLAVNLRGVGRSAQWLIGLWSAGLTVSTIFPTDPTGAPTSMSGYIHRYAGAVMFMALPAAGVLIARKFPALLGVAITASVSSAAFLVSHVSFVGFEARGLTERVLFASLYGLLFAIAALQVRRTS
ncbi:DUF998 domain-containing protein [Lentzea sp. NEAU-D7]|uniref:DUF998 domain-containing protein n=1 Tax=Lentzea sp. NEAU-D7 TaxID=2994667 RepID=UPI00224B83FB|nr:DUF998 domain-containing protein [Lentzea sp. NEAU-D7]MCX2952520.1 DUF998 domain-containing protein [Lentzea sp. NEAU-D7]